MYNSVNYLSLKIVSEVDVNWFDFVLIIGLSKSNYLLQAVWKIRESVAECFSKDGHVFCYDISIPLNQYYELVDATRNYVGEKSHRVFGCGHLGKL